MSASITSFQNINHNPKISPLELYAGPMIPPARPALAYSDDNDDFDGDDDDHDDDKKRVKSWRDLV